MYNLLTGHVLLVGCHNRQFIDARTKYRVTSDVTNQSYSVYNINMFHLDCSIEDILKKYPNHTSTLQTASLSDSNPEPIYTSPRTYLQSLLFCRPIPLSGIGPAPWTTGRWTNGPPPKILAFLTAPPLISFF